MKSSKEVIKMMEDVHTFSTLVTKDFKPSQTSKEIARALLPEIQEDELKSLKNLNLIFQEKFVTNNKRQFRNEVWMQGDENFSSESKLVKTWFKKFTRSKYIKRSHQLENQAALILGTSIASFCKRASFLLQEAARNQITFKQIGILGGNRLLTKEEYAYINESEFCFEYDIKTEFDFMKYVFQHPRNIQAMLSSSGIDPLETLTGQPYQSIETLRNEANVSLDDCFEVYRATPEIVYINSVSTTNRPTTYDTVVDYIKENAITESERIVLASSQPWCDYQQLVTLQAFIEANKVPQFITSIGPRITNIPTQLFANELAKTLYTILENLKKLGVKVE